MHKSKVKYLLTDGLFLGIRGTIKIRLIRLGRLRRILKNIE